MKIQSIKFVKLKINTVVTKLNYMEDLSPVLRDIKVDRWKILKMNAMLEKSLWKGILSVVKLAKTVTNLFKNKF